MSDFVANRNLGKIFVYGCIFLFPIMVGTVKSSGGLIFYLLTIISVVSLTESKRPISHREFLYILLILSFIVASLMSFVNADDLRKSFSRLERVLYFIAFLPLAILFEKLRNHMSLVGISFVAASVALSGIAYPATGRAEGAYNAILFGDYSGIIVVSLAIIVFFSREGVITTLLYASGILLALYALEKSGTRGSWLVILLPIIFVFVFHLKKGSDCCQKYRQVLLFVAIFVLTSYFVINAGTFGRIATAYHEFLVFFSGELKTSSVGFRLMMVKDALTMWSSNPFIGSGLGDFLADYEKLINDGRALSPTAWGEAHNIYVEFLATTGMIGFSAMVFAVFIWPLYLFLINFRIASQDSQKVIALCGIGLVGAYAIFGLSQNWLSRSSITMAYVIYLAFFYAGSRGKNNSSIEHDIVGNENA